jgi:hypothetical protein
VPRGIPDGRLDAAHDRYAASVATGDPLAALACVAATLEELHRSLGAPPAMDGWLDALDAQLAACALRPRAAVEPHVFRAALAVLARRPEHPALPLWHERARAAVQTALPADDVLRAARFSFEYTLRSGHFGRARAIIGAVRERAAQASSEVRAGWLESEALAAWLAADHAAARNAVAAAMAAGGGYGAWEQAASAALSEGDLARADVCLAAMARPVDVARRLDVAHSAFLGAARARLGGDLDGANERIDACMAVDATCTPLYFTTLWQLGRAHVAIARGRHRRAAADLAVVIARAGTLYWQFLHFSALVARAWLRIRERRREEAAQDLAQALALARTHAYRNTDPWWDPEAILEIGRFGQGIARDQATLAALVARAPL